MDPAPPPQPTKRGLLMPIGWSLLAMLGAIGAAAGVGVGLTTSESAGISAAQIAAFPLGFVLSAALCGLIVHIGIKRATTLLRVMAPLGCGCMGGMLMLGAVFGFVLVVLPML